MSFSAINQTWMSDALVASMPPRYFVLVFNTPAISKLELQFMPCLRISTCQPMRP